MRHSTVETYGMYIGLTASDRENPIELVQQVSAQVQRSLERVITRTDFRDIDRIHFEVNIQKKGRLP